MLSVALRICRWLRLIQSFDITHNPLCRPEFRFNETNDNGDFSKNNNGNFIKVVRVRIWKRRIVLRTKMYKSVKKWQNWRNKDKFPDRTVCKNLTLAAIKLKRRLWIAASRKDNRNLHYWDTICIDQFVEGMLFAFVSWVSDMTLLNYNFLVLRRP